MIDFKINIKNKFMEHSEGKAEDLKTRSVYSPELNTEVSIVVTESEMRKAGVPDFLIPGTRFGFKNNNIAREYEVLGVAPKAGQEHLSNPDTTLHLWAYEWFDNNDQPRPVCLVNDERGYESMFDELYELK